MAANSAVGHAARVGEHYSQGNCFITYIFSLFKICFKEKFQKKRCQVFCFAFIQLSFSKLNFRNYSPKKKKKKMFCSKHMIKSNNRGLTSETRHVSSKCETLTTSSKPCWSICIQKEAIGSSIWPLVSSFYFFDFLFQSFLNLKYIEKGKV